MSPALLSGALTPQQWGDSLTMTAEPLQRIDGAMLRRWRGTDGVMEQPPLDHHYLALHLGGPKRVQRRGDGAGVDMNVALGSVTVVPAGSAFRWETRGPSEFAHLYVAPRRLDRTLRDTFDRDPSRVDLAARVGWDDPLAGALLAAMLDPALDSSPDGRLARESWMEALLARLVQQGSSIAEDTPRARNALAPRTLARVKAYMEAHLADEITLDRLAEVAGLSRFHLCRAFRQDTGFPPHVWLTRARLAKARRLLHETDLPIRDVARQCGFASPNQFATCFRKGVGATPSEWRRNA